MNSRDTKKQNGDNKDEHDLLHEHAPSTSASHFEDSRSSNEFSQRRRTMLWCCSWGSLDKLVIVHGLWWRGSTP